MTDLLETERTDTRLLIAVLPVAVVLDTADLMAESLNNEMLDAEMPDAELLDTKMPDADPLEAEVPNAEVPDAEFLNAKLLEAELLEAVLTEAVVMRTADVDGVLDTISSDAVLPEATLADVVPPTSWVVLDAVLSDVGTPRNEVCEAVA